MRKIILSLLLITVFATVPSFGQVERDSEYFPKNEIYIQYGSPTVLELVTMLKAPNSFKDFETTHQIFSGTPGIGYNFRIRRDLSIGIFGGYSFAQSDICPTIGDKVGPAIYSQSVNNYVGMLSANWTYFQEGALTMESGLYLGVAYMDRDVAVKNWDLDQNILDAIPSDSRGCQVAYHITVCKLRYGNTFGVFGELGFGFKGILNIGLSIDL